MKKLIFKSVLYFFLILIVSEVFVRIFHLGKDTPTRLLDKYEVEKWAPNQNGFSVTGNRRQNFSEYHINTSGYNSYREFTPTKDKVEIALVGDSFIEGFHQHYYNSIGKKIENSLPKIEVYEYGYAGYDFADQLHLIHSYKEQFDLIDHIVLGIKFSNDLTRGEYKVVTGRLALESPIHKLLKKSKLLVYCKSIGILDPPQEFMYRMISMLRAKKKTTPIDPKEILRIKEENERKYLANFESLVSKYGYDKNRFTLLLDSRITSPLFISYLKENNFEYIDFAIPFETSNRPTTLIYDRHWNNHGRELIANTISQYLKSIEFTSYKNSKKTVDKLEIAKQYYKALDNSDGFVMRVLLGDSLLTKETKYDYEQTFSQKEYVEEWLKWDSVFNPTYKILEIEQENGIVKAKISKIDKRIIFLHEEPIVTNEIIRFGENKIISIERDNVIFNEKTWGRNVNALLSWVDENHPELNGFLNDQTETGGMNYLKAIELYKNRK